MKLATKYFTLIKTFCADWILMKKGVNQKVHLEAVEN